MIVEGKPFELEVTEADRIDDLVEEIVDMQSEIRQYLHKSREVSLVLTKLDETRMWLNEIRDGLE